MYPYGDTRTQPQPVYDDGDERAARWTVRALAASLFVAVACVAVFLTLNSLHSDDSSPAAAPPPVVETVTTLPPPAEVGPAPGAEVAGYISGRKAALAATTDERVAVVSFAKYSTQAQAKTLAGANVIVSLLVAPPGVGPAVVTGDLAAWTKTQTAAATAERDEIKRLIPTVTDPAFKTFYNNEVTRLDKALKNFAPTSAMVFGMVIKAPAAALKTLGTKVEVRLVDVAPNAAPAPDTVFRGLRPEETAKANEPPLRP
ncbi:MAG TPA: hypothetical protein VJ653_08700 [Acidimicrobiales bacterium]|nr:hypothetical protein [Acidimicrobiales bacterium]